MPLHSDFTSITTDDYGAIDLLVGGTPCQSFSVAGKRLGLDDPRGNLTLEFIKLAQRKRPAYILWENVPGVLSDDNGKTIQQVIDTFTQIGYVCDIDILDAQYFGLAQRRRRVFVVCVRLDVLLRRRTPTSERIMADLLAQALRAIWDAIRPVSSPGKSLSESERLTDELRNSAKKRMNSLQNLLGNCPVTRLLEFWGASHHQFTGEPHPSGLTLIRKNEQPHDGLKTGTGGFHARKAESVFGDSNTASSWNRSLADLWKLLNPSTTSTVTAQITDPIIYSFAEASLNIVHSIISSDRSLLCRGWSKDYWSVAHSFLTVIEGLMKYARQTSFDLFSAAELHSDWRNNLDRARDCYRIIEQHCRDWASSAAVLLEPDSMRGDSPPSRQTQKSVAALTAAGVGTCGADDNQAQAGHLIAGTLKAAGGRSRGAGINPGSLVAFGGNSPEPIDIATARNAHGGPHGRLDFESETFIAHTLRGDGFDASEDGTGRGTPLIPGDGCVFEEGDVTARLTTATDLNANILGFSCKDDGRDCAKDISPTLRSMNADKSHANSGGQVAICYPILEPGARTGASTTDPRAGMGIGDQQDPMFTLQAGKQHGIAVSLRGREGGATAEISGDVMPALRASQGGGDKPHILLPSAVRRLTPEECELLQGMPVGYTRIPWRNKPSEECPDGPRYKAIGNSMAVPCVRWIFDRLDHVHRALLQLERAA